MKTLLLGLGNSILGDDAIGVLLARDLASRLDGTADLDAIPECPASGLDVLDVISGYERIVILDSIHTPDGVPGDWYRFTATRLRDTLHLRNVHDVNLATALELGRRTGMRLPRDEDIHLFAVEIETCVDFSTALSAALAAAYPELRAALLDEVRSLLANG
jgi:hydrogenase maturation protease